MGTQLRCYVCDIELSKRFRKSIFDIKSKHSNNAIAEIIKRIQNGVGTIQAHDGSSPCVSCDDCIGLINTYDEAYMLAERVEKQLTSMIARTEKRYESAKDAIIILDTEQMKSKQIPKESISRPKNAIVADPFDADETHIDGLAELEHGNDADTVNMSEPEEDIESEEETIDSDDSFVWPKTGVLKRRQDKEGATDPDIYRCIECPADFRDKYEMQLHSASHRTPQFRCGICRVRIAKGRESIEHENLHTSRSKLQCVFCDEEFKKKSDLILHVESHNGDTYTICYVCGVRIRTSTMDGRHIRSHLGIRDFECSYCGRKFVDKSVLKAHLRTHTGERPFKCPEPSCEKRFSNFTNMREHSFTHEVTGKRPAYFRDCSICGKVFKRAGLLAQHYQKNHN